MTFHQSLPAALIAGAALLGATRLSASVPLGSGAEGFVTLKAGLEYNDNLFLADKNADSDTIWRLTPGVNILFGQNSLAQGSFTYNEEFKFYSDNSTIDTALSDVKATLAYDNDKTKIGANAGYQQLDQATADTRGAGLVKREVVNASIDGEISLTEKTSFKLGVAYNDTDYAAASFADWEYVQIPVNYYYEVAPKLDASFGFAYKDNVIGNGRPDTEEYYYNVGARGDLAPKLTGELTLGYKQSEPTIGDSSSTFGIDSKFTYAYSEKTSIDANLSNGFGFSGVGDSYRTLGFGGGVTSSISEQLQLSARLSYSNNAYLITTQDDDLVSVSVSATYKYNEYLTFNGSYAYTDNASNKAGSDFTGNVLTLSASLRY